MTEQALLALFAGLFGLVIGSFLNVCIHRLPLDESIVWPGSRCPGCGHPIAAYDNIPLISYALLGARCRHCRRAISWRYPVAELATGILFAAAFLLWGETLDFVKAAIFSALCVGMIFADLETRILPDEFTMGGIAAGIVFAFLTPRRDSLAELIVGSANQRWASALESVIAAALLAGMLWGVGEIFYRLRKMEYLGFGDVKMVAMMAAFLGLASGLIALFIGSMLGAIIGGAYIYFQGKKAREFALPYGTFLGLGALWATFITR